MIRNTGAFVVFLFLVLTLVCSSAQSGNPKTPRLGGPCDYKSYPGEVTIFSITEAQRGGGDRVQRFQVKFGFKPQGDIDEPFAQMEERIFNLYGNNFQYPDREFLKAHDIRVGAVLDGSVQVIVKGACTPLVFDFPALK